MSRSSTAEEQSVHAAIVNDPRWAMVLARDPSADGTFWYAVRTTGVYCRPCCGARTPRPENVAFHTSRREAERAGFRPCKRCRPELPPLAERNAACVAELCRYIEQSEELPSVGELARRVGLSVSHMQRTFKAATGLAPMAYAEARRAERLRGALQRSANVTQAIYDAGYVSSGRFYEQADRVLGMTPTKYRAGGDGVTIRFAVGACSLGAILAAASERGVCAILLGDDPAELTRDLARRFPKARLTGGDHAFAQLFARVVGLVDDPRLGTRLPLDIRGTAFQERVWRALAEIPAGATLTYTELARAIGAPRAVRAVASACAANPLAVAIPCHRAVRSDGSPSGYRWGIARKNELLARERGDDAPDRAPR